LIARLDVPISLGESEAFEEYIPLLYSFAFILDPRDKMKGFTRVLRRLGSLTSFDYSAYLVGTRGRLTDVYNKYDEKFGVVRLRRTNPPVVAEPPKLIRFKCDNHHRNGNQG